MGPLERKGLLLLEKTFPLFWQFVSVAIRSLEIATKMSSLLLVSSRRGGHSSSA